MDNIYDVFISYRRDGGEFVGKSIFDSLSSKGYRCFFDVETMRSGKFNEQIYKVIDNCKDVLVILSQNALDRCDNEEDWVRKEITRAIKQNKNIIPIMLRGFHWPSDLPNEIAELPNYEGINASLEFFDASIQKIEKLLSSSAAVSKGKFATNCDIIFPFGIDDLFEYNIQKVLVLCEENAISVTKEIVERDFLGWFSFEMCDFIELYQKEELKEPVHNHISSLQRELSSHMNKLRDSDWTSLYLEITIRIIISQMLLDLDSHQLDLYYDFVKTLYGMQRKYYKYNNSNGTDALREIIPSKQFSSVVYNNKNYLIRDIYNLNDTKYAYAICDDNDSVIPDISFFKITSDDELIKVSNNTEEYTSQLLSYAMFYRGISIPKNMLDIYMRRIIESLGGDNEVINRSLNYMNYVSSIYEGTYGPTSHHLSFALKRKKLLLSKYIACEIHPSACVAYDAFSRKTVKDKFFGNLLPIDLVSCEFPYIDNNSSCIKDNCKTKRHYYFLLGLEYDKKSNKNQIKNYSIVLSNEKVFLETKGAFNKELKECIGIFEAGKKETPIDIRERFALRYELVRFLGMDFLEYVYPAKYT